MRWCMVRGPMRYERETVPDVYYTQGDNVVRHRLLWDGAGELTVKRRRSRKETTNREEIDLTFTDKVRASDVTAFLGATGWKRVLSLFKDDVHIFWFDLPKGGQVNVAFYAVERLNYRTQKRDRRMQFIEVEVEKGSRYNEKESRAIFEEWRSAIDEAFPLGSPMTLSLFEIYTGRKYKSASLHRG